MGKDKVQVRGWDPKKKTVAPPAIPPDPDIEKEKGPKGINTPNLLKGIKVVGAVLAFALVASLGFYFLVVIPASTPPPVDPDDEPPQEVDLTISVAVSQAGTAGRLNWEIMLVAVPEGLHKNRVGLVVLQGVAPFEPLLTETALLNLNDGMPVVETAYIEADPLSDFITTGDLIVLSLAFPAGSAFQLIERASFEVLAEGTLQ